ncbi:MAG: trypsin-like peptidase domain-containing protein [Bifidobacteriaceae bacterium]|jgi:putative serine protease PepD|nr:trypsin-like peptidase domain-containing protein [Bifidobacteriaceae bacterium]
MADQNGVKNPWDSDESQDAWNPSGIPAAHDATEHDAAAGSAADDSAADSKHDDNDAAPTAAQPPVSVPDAATAPDVGAEATTPIAPVTPSSSSADTAAYGTSGYSPAPEYGANTANPTQPLPASSYPFGGPEKPEPKAAKQNSAQAQNQGNGSGNPFSIFGFGGDGSQNGQNANGQSGNAGNPQNPNAQQPQQNGGQFPGLFGAPNGQNGPAANGGPAGPSAPNGFNGQGNGNNGGASGENRTNGGTASRSWFIAIISAVIAALLVVGLGYAGISSGLISLPQSSSTSSLTSGSDSDGTAKVEGTNSADWASVNKKVAKSVVSITATVSGGEAKGSGAIIDTKGDIVTNNHVVEGATSLQVTLSDGKTYSAKTVGTDSTTDLAVIKLENPPSGLQAVTFADSSDLAVGESIMAIGNPLGYENTATTGIVSALNRPVSVTDETSNSEVVTNAVQIDAAINPGNSGGPTFNAAGQVIGINSSIATASTSSSSQSSSDSGSIGIGFAIPSNLVQRVAKQIVKSGKATHAQLGVTITEGTATVDGATYEGAKINSVNSGGPASKAGLKSGDVIVGFNGSTVSSMYSVLGYVRAAAVGDTVKLTVVRNSKTLDISVTLTEAESTSSSSSSGNSNGNSNNDGSGNSDGNSDGNGSGNSDGNGSGGLSDPFGLFGGN